MGKLDRREFLVTSGFAGLAVISSGHSSWLNTLVPGGDQPADGFTYRGWEDIYRDEYAFDHVAFSSHCVNCQGNCALKVFVKDGIVLREEQVAGYPQISPAVPDTNPRGCQKGALHSDSMYEADRIRYPMKRVGERGQGKWQRISWDQATKEIADKVIDLYEEFGPGSVMTQPGTGASSNGKLSACYRFASLMGGVLEDGFTNVGDLNTGVHLAYGDPLQAWTTDAWFEADYIMMTMINPAVTRMPDAHFITEARYRGARVVSVVPDYNPSTIHSDLWINIRPGADPYLFMSMVHTILTEDLLDRDFVSEQTDLPLLVRQDNGKLLRQSDRVPDGKDDIFYVWDTASGAAVEAPGSPGTDNASLALGAIVPALEGEFSVDGIAVQPAFVHMRREAMKFSPEATRETTGIHPDVVRGEARRIAAAKRLCIMDGFAVGKLLNCIYIGWSQALLCALTGHGGPRGGIDPGWVDDGLPATFRLALMEFTKTPRFEPGGLGSFLRGDKMVDARKHFDPIKLKQRVGFDLDELQVMIDEVIESGQMPYDGKVKGLISIADSMLARNKGANYRKRFLELVERLYVNVNTRMDYSARWADYLLPAASHYEGWDIRKTAQHRFYNLSTAPVPPIGEAKPDFDILVLLTKKIQERAIARGVGHYPDSPVSRDLHTIHDDFTMNGALMTAEEQIAWMVENSPELGGQTLEQGLEDGFLTVWESEWPVSSHVRRDKPIMPWEKQVVDKAPYPTLSGRITFYCDHDWFRKLDSTVPTARPNAGKEASRHPYTFYTPHTRWGVHTNWRANPYIQRLQRGEPYVYISPATASSKRIDDGDTLRVFNALGSFECQAKVVPGVRDDQVMMEHAWENTQFKDMRGLNDVVATLLQPLELVGNWGHLKFSLYRWNANQVGNESSVDIERVERR